LKICYIVIVLYLTTTELFGTDVKLFCFPFFLERFCINVTYSYLSILIPLQVPSNLFVFLFPKHASNLWPIALYQIVTYKFSESINKKSFQCLKVNISLHFGYLATYTCIYFQNLYKRVMSPRSFVPSNHKDIYFEQHQFHIL